jgi:hypothetical protein
VKGRSKIRAAACPPAPAAPGRRGRLDCHGVSESIGISIPSTPRNRTFLLSDDDRRPRAAAIEHVSPVRYRRPRPRGRRAPGRRAAGRPDRGAGSRRQPERSLTHLEIELYSYPMMIEAPRAARAAATDRRASLAGLGP